MHKCKEEKCFVPHASCALGYTEISRCPVWSGGAAAELVEPDVTDEILLPWSGSALGLADLGFVSGRARPFVIGIVGAQNAGKTTLLGAWYLLLARGAIGIPERQFAGSYSLAGWEAVSGSFRWSPGQPPTFPPHTTSRGRTPGLLHLSFRDAGRMRAFDYLFADAPGEWFRKWAVNRDAEESAGARWIADRADVLLIVADQEALSAKSKGPARNALELLARRLASERTERPVALVWTKSDIPITHEMECAVRDAVTNVIPDVTEFRVSVVSDHTRGDGDGVGLIELLGWILKVRHPRITLPPLARNCTDPLFLYGAR